MPRLRSMWVQSGRPARDRLDRASRARASLRCRRRSHALTSFTGSSLVGIRRSRRCDSIPRMAPPPFGRVSEGMPTPPSLLVTVPAVCALAPVPPVPPVPPELAVIGADGRPGSAFDDRKKTLGRNWTAFCLAWVKGRARSLAFAPNHAPKERSSRFWRVARSYGHRPT